MCGGIIYNLAKVKKSDLEKFYNEKEIERFEKTGQAESYFWQKQPVLPIEIEDKVELLPWGNRDKEIRLPLTGWAKQESIDAGKWNYLKPKFIKISAEQGIEKGVKFEIDAGIQGLVVEKDGERHAYMVTKAATPEYLNLTHHDREPVLLND